MRTSVGSVLRRNVSIGGGGGWEDVHLDKCDDPDYAHTEECRVYDL